MSSNNNAEKGFTSFEAYDSLAPIASNNTSTSKFTHLENYSKLLNSSITNENSNICNIALVGPYSSGKSSIINLSCKNLPENKQKYIKISLAKFKDNATTKELEEHLLEQLVPQAPAQSSSSDTLSLGLIDRLSLVASFFITSLIILLLIFVKMDNLEATVIYSIFEEWILASFLGALFISFFAVIYLSPFIIKKLKLQKIKTPGCELQFDTKSSNNTSLFVTNANSLKEYFLQNNYQIVFIEDLDRFGNTEIFWNLRELNHKLNHQGQKNKVTFVYAITDGIFADHINNSKFFDFVLNIIPSLTTLNSFIKLTQELNLFDNTPLSFEEAQQFAPYICDYRTYNLIINAYKQYFSFLNIDKTKWSTQYKLKLISLMIVKIHAPSFFNSLYTPLNSPFTNFQQEINKHQVDIDISKIYSSDENKRFIFTEDLKRINSQYLKSILGEEKFQDYSSSHEVFITFTKSAQAESTSSLISFSDLLNKPWLSFTKGLKEQELTLSFSYILPTIGTCNSIYTIQLGNTSTFLQKYTNSLKPYLFSPQAHESMHVLTHVQQILQNNHNITIPSVIVDLYNKQLIENDYLAFISHDSDLNFFDYRILLDILGEKYLVQNPFIDLPESNLKTILKTLHSNLATCSYLKSSLEINQIHKLLPSKPNLKNILTTNEALSYYIKNTPQQELISLVEQFKLNNFIFRTEHQEVLILLNILYLLGVAFFTNALNYSLLFKSNINWSVFSDNKHLFSLYLYLILNSNYLNQSPQEQQQQVKSTLLNTFTHFTHSSSSDAFSYTNKQNFLDLLKEDELSSEYYYLLFKDEGYSISKATGLSTQEELVLLSTTQEKLMTVELLKPSHVYKLDILCSLIFKHLYNKDFNDLNISKLFPYPIELPTFLNLTMFLASPLVINYLLQQINEEDMLQILNSNKIHLPCTNCTQEQKLLWISLLAISTITDWLQEKNIPHQEQQTLCTLLSYIDWSIWFKDSALFGQLLLKALMAYHIYAQIPELNQDNVNDLHFDKLIESLKLLYFYSLKDKSSKDAELFLQNLYECEQKDKSLGDTEQSLQRQPENKAKQNKHPIFSSFAYNVSRSIEFRNLSEYEMLFIVLEKFCNLYRISYDAKCKFTDYKEQLIETLHILIEPFADTYNEEKPSENED